MRHFSAGLMLAGLAACASPASQAPAGPETAMDALDAYYATIPDAALPRAPAGPALPDGPLSRILVGSCNDEEKASPALSRIAREEADLFLMVGDNVYGDRDGPVYANNQADLSELRESLAELAARAAFQAVRKAHPMMVAWDDHDYGANDAGREFPFKRLAERVHETFWGLGDSAAATRPGTYYARSFGPEGQRVQVIMLDTRFFRSSLKRSDARGTPGKERYIPQGPDTDQSMLGEAQWAWLENRLAEPADVRFIVSSIQVLTTNGHGYEHWNNLPAERDRLFELVDETGANGLVFVSGDRHTAFLYEREDITDYPVRELTASSLNLSFSETSDERDRAQLGAGYAKTNFGVVEIDWPARQIALQVKSETGATVRETRFAIP